MPKAPTTYKDLRNAVSTDREALTLAAVLPNLPKTERVIDLRGQAGAFGERVYWDTDAKELAAFRRYETPIVPDTDLYRVRSIVHEPGNGNRETYVGVEPVPHGRRVYEIKRHDYAEFVTVDPEDAEYDDTDQTFLDDYGAGNPYYNPWEANRDAFEREPHLPV